MILCFIYCFQIIYVTKASRYVRRELFLVGILNIMIINAVEGIQKKIYSLREEIPGHDWDFRII